MAVEQHYRRDDSPEQRHRRADILVRYTMRQPGGGPARCHPTSMELALGQVRPLSLGKAMFASPAYAAECARELLEAGHSDTPQEPYPCFRELAGVPHWHLRNVPKSAQWAARKARGAR